MKLRYQDRTPQKLHTDMGKEFYNSQFESLMESYNIKLYSTYSNLNASIIGRFNRTLKNMIWPEFSLHGNYKWLDTLSTLVSKYNGTKHRSIGMKPKDVTTDDEEELRQRFYEHRKIPMRRQKIKVGDKVRVSKLKNVFEKGYIANWSTEIFTIS